MMKVFLTCVLVCLAELLLIVVSTLVIARLDTWRKAWYERQLRRATRQKLNLLPRRDRRC